MSRAERTAVGFLSSEQAITKAKLPLGITAKEIELKEGELTNAYIKAAAAIEESKLSIPEMVKLATVQEITGQKTFSAATTTFKEIQVTGIKGLTSLILTTGSFALEKEKFYLGPSAGADAYTVVENETLDTASQATLKTECVIALKSTAERIIYGAKAGATRGKLFIFYNASTFNLVFENESALEEIGKKPAEATEQFKFSTKANITLKPGETLWLYQNTFSAEAVDAGWREIGGSFSKPPGGIYTAGEGLELVVKEFKVKALGITNAMLAGSIEDAKLLLTTVVKLTGAQEIKGVKTFAEEIVANGTITGKAITGTSGVFSTTLKVKETLTAEGAATVAKTLKVTELTTTTGGLTVEGTLTLPAGSIKTAAIEKENVTKEKLAKEAQEELLTVAAFPGLSAYTSAKEETEAKPTFITMLVTIKGEAVLGKVKFVNDAKEVVYQWDPTITGILKQQLTFLIKKGGKWKATLEGSVEKMEIARQVINSV